ncbi:DUF4350 domain-containing protein [Lysobacter auxotrophicus]|uniref:DUF4350 domain-containing protein n=1 Tax=Lysobacter auxotrophicus TaxID=2992573 RepID=A0ABM8D929_9GAMM|nr:DUF4350 domain-containing protein [Lysobacter auxotrophicus]BDU15049.1 DUF4350 domain-containing protein [Lysobacter auxotrophicus]
MTLTRRHGLIALLVLAVAGAVAGGAAWWQRNFERTEEWVDLPRTGEAARNPLYVLKLALIADGVQAQSRPRLQLGSVALGPRDTVLLYNDPRTLTGKDEATLLEWVERGGHLLLRTPPPGPLDVEKPVPVLAAFGLHPRSDELCAGLDVAGEDPHVEFCRGRRLDIDNPDSTVSLHWGEPELGYVFARVPHGRGHVDVLSDFDFLDNDSLKDGPHIALTRQLLDPNYRAGTVHLIYEAQMPSFWMTLVREHWRVWLPLLLALMAWLWRRSQRFGPLLDSPAVERRSLLEHVTASGEHVYRYGYAHLLHEAARKAFLARLRRRDPQAAALDGDAQAAMLAERFGLPADDIRNALSTPIARDHAAFRSRIAMLIRMRNSL